MFMVMFEDVKTSIWQTLFVLLLGRREVLQWWGRADKSGMLKAHLTVAIEHFVYFF